MGQVIVVGSINLDLGTRVDRLPARGETVRARHQWQALGGKGANQAVAAHRAGAEVRLLGSVGTDAAGDAVLAELNALGVGLDEIARIPVPTGVAELSG